MSMNNFPRGSEWRQWDLHVHTPESLTNGYKGDWNRFLLELEQLPPEFAVIGVNDYLFLDGYKRLKEEKDKNGRLRNIQTLFPVVEFRIKRFAGVEFRNTTRTNLHIIFDPELDAAVIESQFLNAIQSAYALEAGVPANTWSAVVTRDSLAELGKNIKSTVPNEKRSGFDSDLEEGFNNLNVDETQLVKHLESNSFLRGHYLVGIGKSEWDKMRWDNTSIAEKKDVINKAHLVFTAAETVPAFHNARTKLAEQGVNSLLLDCSDAHYFKDATSKDRIGNCFTWIKADPTFEGLKQLINEPQGRCFVGDVPPKLDLVTKNKTKFISSVKISRKPEATISEVWFDDLHLQVNPDLVAIIGNKGKGKSALTDTIGLLSNTKQHRDFTFLSDDNFRNVKDNKAKHFEAALTWKSETTTQKGLDETVDEQQPELVKYIPQNFLEKICTQIGKIEESDFDRELKKVIFSHVAIPERMGKASLDELITYKTSEAIAKSRILKQALHDLNMEIVLLEEQGAPAYRQRLENLLKLKQEELTVHENAKPASVNKPENNPDRQKEIATVASQVEDAKQTLTECERKILEANKQQSTLIQQISTSDKLIARLENLQGQLKAFTAESAADFASVGVTEETVFRATLDTAPLQAKRIEFVEQKNQVDGMLDPDNAAGLVQKKQEIETSIEKLQTKLDEPNKRYQAYQTALNEWEKKRQALVGSADTVGSVAYYDKQLQALELVPTSLAKARSLRLTKSKELHAVIRQLADTYRELYAPVNQFIERRPLANDKFHLNFEVGIVDTGFQDRFFEMISHGVAGTFCGRDEGRKMLKDILARQDFNTEDGLHGFLTEIIDSLETDKRQGAGTVRVSDQVRKGKTPLSLYDMIFSLDYLMPRYALRMGEKELQQLSPGERGTLLLVFYLLVDKDDIPLVIDQPEENLDNQTVYELLVPCIKEAKQRRQIFIVTHNPNLAVVCDAEQVICADLDKKNGYRMRYIAGAIENPKINKAIVDVLEGTRPAFDNRDAKYQNKPNLDFHG